MVGVLQWVHAFYRSAAWLRKRAEILIRDNFECQKCKRRGRFARAICVHHIKHLRDRPELALVDDNLLSLCLECHETEHPERLRKNIISKKPVIEERW